MNGSRIETVNGGWAATLRMNRAQTPRNKGAGPNVAAVNQEKFDERSRTRRPGNHLSETDGEGTDGRGTAGIIDEKNREAEAAEADASALDLDGDDSDGQGSTGILEEQVREARAGETGSDRSGTEGSDTDGAGSGGILDD